MTCQHDLAEMETACADGCCPLCMQKELEEAQRNHKQLINEFSDLASIIEERDQFKQELAEAQETIICQDTLEEGLIKTIGTLQTERDQFKQELEEGREDWVKIADNYNLLVKERDQLRDAVREFVAVERGGGSITLGVAHDAMVAAIKEEG
jgi:DNA repair exonuclease SbcCD ATPase subunit